jgi:hypothetical protein
MVAMALPAYIGRLKVLSSTTASTSVRGEQFSTAAARGMKFLPLFVAGAHTCVYFFATCTTTELMSSARECSSASLLRTRTFVTLEMDEACLATASTFLPATRTVICRIQRMIRH